MKVKEDVDIGAIIKRIIDEMGLTISDFARLLNPSTKDKKEKRKVNRNQVYSILNSKNLDFQTLQAISKVLNRELILEYIEVQTPPEILLIKGEKSKIEEIFVELSKDKLLTINRII